MFEKLKANILFDRLMKRHDIDKAYAMVGPEDSWYDTITTVHRSLSEIRKLPHEDWQIKSHDGLALKALFYPGTTDKTMIWIHGYTSHAERESAFPSLFYHSLGFNVLIPYLRAHGPSQGKYISFGPMESLDMQKWVEKVNERMPNGSILLHGLSMGGGIALDLAAVEMKNVKALVSDAPSVSIPAFYEAVTHGTFKSGQEKIIDCIYRRYLKEFGVSPAGFDRTKTIEKGRYPLLLTAGSNEGMDDMLDSLRNSNPMDTSVLILPGCNHGNGMYKQTELYQNAIKVFLKKCGVL